MEVYYLAIKYILEYYQTQWLTSRWEKQYKMQNIHIILFKNMEHGKKNTCKNICWVWMKA